ncbi:electron transport complex subunit RsxC [Mangrovicoccus ximenensis]|uniref:electron transport complex subunit RsxC n=1 Tax=Mangrovicoccus ximenensis TaxID=1911570 RepID=UPI000D3D37F2|nr:electron transport complex subunit RsxC [Mangrovicoccus ximenensis]
MKLFSLDALKRSAGVFAIKGGIHPETRKYLTAECTVEKMPVPAILRVPLQQHIGAQAEPLVQRGDHVLKGQLIGKARGPVSANVHAPTSGRVLAVGMFAAPHPSGLPVMTVTIRPDGRDEWGPRLPRLRPEAASAEQIADRVLEAGIVGMGGATFPAAVKLRLGQKYDLHTLVINAAECEPYLTCDDRLLRERAEEVVDGIAMMAKALGAGRAIVAIEANKPKAIAEMRRHIFAAAPEAEVRAVPVLYPMGSEKHLVRAVLGLETPARALTAELGVIVHNAATAHAVHKAVRYGEPLISRFLTVSGRGVATPKNLEVMIGTPVSDILAFCGGLKGEPDRLLLGGPMMGMPIRSVRVPVIKGTNGVLALDRSETRPRQSMPCIRCAGCVTACPCGLAPLELQARIGAEDLEGAVDIGLMDCVACGSCSYVCPSNIPLVQSFNYAKGKLAVLQGRKHQQEETRRLAEARKAREEAVAEAKRKAMEKHKAAQAARKKAAGEKKRREAEAAAQADAGEAPAVPPERDGASEPREAAE